MFRTTFLLALVALACQATPASDDAAADQLYKSVIVGDYDSAVAQSKDLDDEQRGDVISKAVDKLIDDSQRNVMDYAYQLYNRDGKDLVYNYFPLQFKSIFSEHAVRLINRRHGKAIKLGVKVDGNGDRTAYSDTSFLSDDIVAWKIIPHSSDSRVYFKIYSTYYNQFLKLEIATDSSGDHEAYGSTESDAFRHQWYLQPVKYLNELVFFIFNREYHQALKPSRYMTSDGDRLLYGDHGNVFGKPDLYGWMISTI